MGIDEEKKLRKQIREILLGYDELKKKDSIIKKDSFDEIKNDTLNKIIDIKNKLDDPDFSISDKNSVILIDNAINSLLQLKALFSNSL
jgi:hypothetical protein